MEGDDFSFGIEDVEDAAPVHPWSHDYERANAKMEVMESANDLLATAPHRRLDERACPAG